MSVYLVKGKGWRYDFTLNGQRNTEAWFSTKRQAKEAEARKREEVLRPQPIKVIETTPTDMGFLELLNKRLDYIKAYYSEKHYRDLIYYAKRWAKKWGRLLCSQITQEMVEEFIMERRAISEYTANKELRYLRATFNYGLKKRLTFKNPTEGIDFFAEDEKIKYIPPKEDIEKIVSLADNDVQDYLICIMDTMARVNEINKLCWEDVNFSERYIRLFTRKKHGGRRASRKVAMTQRLYEILLRRYQNRDETKPWVFWHHYIDRKTGQKITGPYKDRRRIMRTLCEKGGVKYFRYHPLRHSGASILDQNRVPTSTIQKILGHEDRRTTEIYLHSLNEEERLAIAKFEQSTKTLTQTLTQPRQGDNSTSVTT